MYKSGIYQGLYKGEGIHNGKGGDYVIIGGKSYPFVKIGNQIWLAKNLDFIDDSMDFGKTTTTSSKAQANYYSNDEATYKKYGVLYNWLAVKHINDNRNTICPGWHVPADTEYSALLSFVGSTNTAKKLKSVEWNGTDEYGFSMLPSGQFNNNAFSQVGEITCFWTSTKTNETVSRRLNVSYNDLIETGYATSSSQFPIRLVKD